MKFLKILFFKEEEFSWRKALTAVILLIFTFITIGYEFGLKEIPDSYQAIIAGVFIFYFGKDLISNKKVKIE